MILTAQALAAAKVRFAAMVLTPHIIETPLTKPRQGPVRTVIAVCQNHITPIQMALLLAKQRHLTTLFALIGTHAQRGQGATGQVKHPK